MNKRPTMFGQKVTLFDQLVDVFPFLENFRPPKCKASGTRYFSYPGAKLPGPMHKVTCPECDRKVVLEFDNKHIISQLPWHRRKNEDYLVSPDDHAW